MISQVSTPAWLACAYALTLLLCAYGIDALARRASRTSRLSATSGFVFHENHDAWLCPQDQWLWPTTFDPDNRVMRYRASPSICNACPVKPTCTSSSAGREVVRAVDPWPASEAARFHRGIACSVVVMGIIWPIGVAFTRPPGVELPILLVVSLLVAIGGLPLFSHLRASPASFPEGAKIASLDETLAAKADVAATQHRRRTKYRSAARPTRESRVASRYQSQTRSGRQR